MPTPLDFPSAPTVGQQYTAPTGVVYAWDGAVWTAGPATTGLPPTGSAGGDLQGSYPNPTLTPAAKSKWTDTGTALAPVDATKIVAVSGAAGGFATLLAGNATVKGRLQSAILAGAGTGVGLFANRDWSTNAQDDATKPSWGLSLKVDTDNLILQRAPAGSTTQTNLLTLDATGDLLVPAPGIAGGATGDAFTFGNRTAKGRINSNNATAINDAVRLNLNRNNNLSTPAQDDAALPTWEVCLRSSGGDDFRVLRSAANTMSQTTPFYVQGSDGKTYCTLANSSVTRAMIATGHTLNGPVANVQLPSGTTWSTPLNTWLLVCTTPAMTLRGGPVLISASPALRYAGSAAGNTIYLGWGRDGAVTVGFRFDVGFGVSGVWSLPFQGFTVWDTAGLTGSHTYSFWVLVVTNAGTLSTLADSPGYFQAVEFS